MKNQDVKQFDKLQVFKEAGMSIVEQAKKQQEQINL